MSKRILCIDDDPDILECLNIIFQEVGYNVVTSGSPSNIFDLIQQHEPDLIIMDINMGPYNGLEICKAMRSYIRTENTPVFMISAEEVSESAMEEYGATDVILKPFNTEQLVEKIDSYLAPKIIPFNTEESENNLSD